MDTAADTAGTLSLEGALALIDRGGPVVAILLVLSVIVVAVTLAKIYQLHHAGVGRHRRATLAVRQWREGNTAAAFQTASDDSLASETVARAMDLVADNDAELAREQVESFAATRLHALGRLTGLLDTIAQVAPLLGLFGTVLGMIEAFQALEGAGAAVDPSILAGGIWVALLTTAVGLAVAMPASVLASWFDGRLENERVALDALLTDIFAAPELVELVPETAVPGHPATPRAAATATAVP
ncbi:MotA/TolQ/ExbB proton channel family protein [Acuticoccus mangrovi]|uniref:MotA/TolQ/ExbB proton channel family protein n=1 Tax=Acuticoccus mangrovi TaxID=2796142 RepID=A0A934IQ57_9HYPH|nr:MotA/TolQ/ExbB proton channel family protein [Acuticoccus mangrovi]MBJ3776010.1 MotA/TolQ/ExbB proton channel family protein [Acuticoccus mangrovi]